MGNAAVAEDLSRADELDELDDLDASHTGPEDDEDDEDDDEAGGVRPESMPHE